MSPKLDIDVSELSSGDKLEEAVEAWLKTREGRAQIDSFVEYIRGAPRLTVPPPPPETTAKEYNPALDYERPGDIGELLR